MKRFQYVICLTFAVSGFAGCGGGNQIGDVVGDVPDEDRLSSWTSRMTKVSLTKAGHGRTKASLAIPWMTASVDDSDVNGDIDDIDGGDESGGDTLKRTGAWRDASRCPDDGLFCTEEYRDSLGE